MRLRGRVSSGKHLFNSGEVRGLVNVKISKVGSVQVVGIRPSHLDDRRQAAARIQTVSPPAED